MSYRSLIDVNVDVDYSNLEARLDELSELDPSDLSDRVSALESLNTCGKDVNDLVDEDDVRNVVHEILDGQNFASDSTVESQGDRIEQLEAALAEANILITSLIEDVEHLAKRDDKANNIFALLGRIVTELLK
jgi:hypothetical protein